MDPFSIQQPPKRTTTVWMIDVWHFVCFFCLFFKDSFRHGGCELYSHCPGHLSRKRFNFHWKSQSESSSPEQVTAWKARVYGCVFDAPVLWWPQVLGVFCFLIYMESHQNLHRMHNQDGRVKPHYMFHREIYHNHFWCIGGLRRSRCSLWKILFNL